MSLVPDYGNSSDSSSSDDESESDELSKIEEPPRPASPPKIKLPTPNFNGSDIIATGPQKTSVFKNPFIEAENSKEAALQKHVKMVDSKNNVVVINGKKICWNYRKGKCRFGHNCKFAHDSDIQNTTTKQNSNSSKKSGELQPAKSALKQESDVKKGKRKRPGLTQGLVPGKKVMKTYLNQKS